MLLAWLYAKVQAVTPYSFRTKCPLEVLVTNDTLHHCNRHSWNHQEQPESCAVSKISPYKLDIHCLNRAVSTEISPLNAHTLVHSCLTNYMVLRTLPIILRIWCNIKLWPLTLTTTSSRPSFMKGLSTWRERNMKLHTCTCQYTAKLTYSTPKFTDRCLYTWSDDNQSTLLNFTYIKFHNVSFTAGVSNESENRGYTTSYLRRLFLPLTTHIVCM